MNGVKEQIINLECITPKDANYFFGYYDIPSTSADGKYHLVHKVDFMDREPEEGDIAGIGMIDLDTKEYMHITETNAWNFQQGTMLQWHPLYPNEKIIYNERIGDKYFGCIYDIKTKEKKQLSMPVATVSPKGDYALGINFNRIYDYRTGYGYKGVKDKFYDDNHPSEDGVFRIDLETGESKQILSYEDLWKLTKDYQNEPERKLLVNHITFNTDGSSFVFLLRCFRCENDSDALVTSVLTSDIDGKNVKHRLGYTMASHYYWKDSDNLLIYSDGPRDWQLYLINMSEGTQTAIDTDYFTHDGHCSYCPDRSLILYDSYPDENSYNNLYLYNVDTKKGITLGSYYCNTSLYSDIWDARCDLHPRWSPDGKYITFDGIHEGKRQIYRAEITEEIKKSIL